MARVPRLQAKLAGLMLRAEFGAGAEGVQRQTATWAAVCSEARAPNSCRTAPRHQRHAPRAAVLLRRAPKPAGLPARRAVQVQASEPLTRILEVILALGNILNRGSTRGNAAGFKLSSLTKLVETKAANKSTTLLHYLAKTVEAKSAELVSFAKTLPTLEAGSRIKARLAALRCDAPAVAARRLLWPLCRWTTWAGSWPPCGLG